MTEITVHPVDTSTERKIITALIVSTKFCAQIIPILRPEYIEVDYVKIVIRWVTNYFKEYKKAPANHIQDLFEQNRKRLKPAMAEIIEAFLITLSENYVLDNTEETSFNSDYYIDLAYEHFRERSLQLHLSIVNSLLEQGKRKEAGEEVEKFRQLQKDIYPYETLTPEVVERVLIRRDTASMLTFPGKMGNLIGGIERGWLISFLGPMKRGKCLDGGTEILLSNGKIRTIKQMFDKKLNKKKYKVVVLNDEYNLVEGNVLDVICNGEQSIYKVRTRTGKEIKITKNHPLLTVSGWKELEQLKEMDYIAVPRELIFWGKEALPDYKLRLLGYLISEGGITKGVTFTNYDRDMLKDFEQCAIAMGDKVTKIKYTDGQLLHVRKNIPYSHTIPNYTEKWLRKLGLFGKKSSGKFIPDIIFSLNKKDVALFLRTLFTGDGHVCSGPHGEEVGYGSMSEKLVRQVQHLLLRFGIVSTVKSKITSYGTTGWGVAIRDKDNVIKFINTIGFLFSKGEKARIICDKLSGTKRRRGFMDIFPGEYSKTINSYIVRPKTRAWYRQLSLRWLEQSLRTGGTLNRGVVQDIAGIINNGELNKMAYSDILWDRIEKIEYCGVEQTYDLCLQNNHNFVANDIIVHNSFFLLETAFQSVINGVKCLFISLEMSADEVWERFIKRITSCGEQEGNIFYPTFDCLRNQDGSCTIKQRINQVKLLKDGMFKPEPGKEPAGYKSCSICRSDYKGGKNHPYIPETWFEGIKRERLDYAMVLKKISGINRMYNMNKIFRVLTFPTHSTNLAKMEIHLKQWEDSDGWMPDVIVIDYADILAPEDNRESGRDRIDNTWKELKRIASSRRCVVATATQANRASIEKFMVKQIHASEDIRKVAHVDVMLSLNQTPWEKSAGAMRIGVVAHRHKGFLETESVTILQNLSVGQSLLDSEFGVVESFMERKKE